MRIDRRTRRRCHRDRWLGGIPDPQRVRASELFIAFLNTETSPLVAAARFVAPPRWSSTYRGPLRRPRPRSAGSVKPATGARCGCSDSRSPKTSTAGDRQAEDQYSHAHARQGALGGGAGESGQPAGQVAGRVAAPVRGSLRGVAEEFSGLLSADRAATMPTTPPTGLCSVSGCRSSR